MTEQPSVEPGSGRRAAPDERLRRAEAFVIVENLDQPACTEDDAHHLLDVLRLANGAVVAASDGAGRARLCRVDDSTPTGGRERRSVRRGRQIELTEPGPILCFERPTPPLTVGFALQKGDRAEWAVQKLTELGIDRIVPLVTQRTIVRLDDEGGRRRGERLRRTAREATCQARRLYLPDVLDPVTLASFLAENRENATGSVVFAEPGGPVLEAATTTVLVGPEGGWAPTELADASGLLGLGATVLRAETATLVAATLLAARRWDDPSTHARLTYGDH